MIDPLRTRYALYPYPNSLLPTSHITHLHDTFFQKTIAFGLHPSLRSVASVDPPKKLVPLGETCPLEEKQR
jgi:hypothetical protein